MLLCLFVMLAVLKMTNPIAKQIATIGIHWMMDFISSGDMGAPFQVYAASNNRWPPYALGAAQIQADIMTGKVMSRDGVLLAE